MATQKEVEELLNSNYAENFIETVLTDIGEADRELPKVNIIYYESMPVDENDNELPGMRGLFLPDANEIKIFDFQNETVDGLKIALRHELLHFILLKLGRPYRDTDKDFLKLAIKYHACAYGMLEALGINLETLINKTALNLR